MAIRILSFTLLLTAYGSASVYLSEDRTGILLQGLPIILVALVASLVPRWSSPLAITALGVGSFLLTPLAGVGSGGLLSLLLVAVQLMAVVLFGLMLAESRDPGTATEGASCVGGLLSEEMARAVLVREMRRSRRTGSPMSLMMLTGIAGLEPEMHRRLVDLLVGEAREFDTVFAASADELGIVCIDTDLAGARLYADRLGKIIPVGDIRFASFPDDAVTSQGLIDLVRGRTSAKAAPRAVAIAE